MREALESLTLGRLRIASKATERQGDELLEVEEARRREEGMYMIGQAAQLQLGHHHDRALHEEIGEGAAAYLAALDRRRPRDPPQGRRPATRRHRHRGDVAYLPGAERCFRVLGKPARLEGRDHRDPGPPLGLAALFRSRPHREDKIYSKWGGFLDDMPFDPMRYGIPPRAVKAIDPLQLMTLELAAAA